MLSSEARNQSLNSERTLGRTDRPETQEGELLSERAVNGTVGWRGREEGVWPSMKSISVDVLSDDTLASP